MAHNFLDPSEKSLILKSPSTTDNLRETLVEIPIELTSKLSTKRQNFVHALVKNNLNVAKACEEAGISTAYGYRLQNDPLIRSYYTALMNQRSFWQVTSHQEALSLATDIARGNCEGDEVVNMKTGKVHTLKVSNRDRLKALDLLYKYHKLVEPESLRDSQPVNIVVDIEGLDELNPYYVPPKTRKDITPDGEYLEY